MSLKSKPRPLDAPVPKKLKASSARTRIKPGIGTANNAGFGSSHRRVPILGAEGCRPGVRRAKLINLIEKIVLQEYCTAFVKDRAVAMVDFYIKPEISPE